MGNTISAPETPTLEAHAGSKDKCPDCGHNAPLGDPDFAILHRLFRRPVVGTCSHSHVIQDALVDDVERCMCKNDWHR